LALLEVWRRGSRIQPTGRPVAVKGCPLCAAFVESRTQEEARALRRTARAAD
jgi:hypothetical protein